MMLNPKSYAAVSKASVVSAAPPQPAAVPKPKLSTAPSMMSTDLKPSVASKLAVNTTSLKVKLPCVQLLVIDRWIGISSCVYILSRFARRRRRGQPRRPSWTTTRRLTRVEVTLTRSRSRTSRSRQRRQRCTLTRKHLGLTLCASANSISGSAHSSAPCTSSPRASTQASFPLILRSAVLVCTYVTCSGR